MPTKPSRSRSSIHIQVRLPRSSLQETSNFAEKFASSNKKSHKVSRRASLVHSEISHLAGRSQLSDAPRSITPIREIHLIENENPAPIVSGMPNKTDCTDARSKIKSIDVDSPNYDSVRHHHHQTQRRNHKNRTWRYRLLYFLPFCIFALATIIAAICLAILFPSQKSGTAPTTTSTTSATSTTATTSTTSSTSTSTSTSTSRTTSTTSTTSSTSTSTSTSTSQTTSTTSTTSSTSTSATTSTSRTTSTTSTTSSTSTSATTSTSRTTSTTSVTSATTTTATTSTTDVPCSPTCNSQKICIHGACVGFGYLSFAMTWSRSGDGDIVIKTPNNKVIYYRNLGPSTSTDQGALDRDDLSGNGPENVVWLNSSGSSPPPSGNYHVCFEPFAFSTSISTSNPMVVLLRILRSTAVVRTFQRTFTSAITNGYDCDSSAPNLLGSYAYP